MRSTTWLLSILFVISASADSWTVAPFQPNLPLGGRAVAVAINPVDSRVAIVASESGGLFVTRDDGATWSHVDAVRPNRMVDVAFAPRRGDIVIATAGNDLNTVNPLGIWRSADGGTTWNQPMTPDACLRANPDAFGISFQHGTSRVYVATSCGLAVSEDLGATWGTIAGPASGGPQLLSVKVSGDTVYASTMWELWRRPVAGGAWTGPLTPSVGPSFNTLALDASPIDANVVFYVDAAMRIFESDDSGATWRQLTDSPTVNRPGWVRATKTFDSALDVYWGDGYNTFRQTCRGGSGSRCGGTWDVVPMRADSNSIAFHPTTACPQYVVTDGGIHRNAASAAGAPCPSSYTQIRNGASGYNALQLYEVASQRQATGWRDDIYFGTQDNNLYASIDGGGTWPGVVGAEGFALQVAPHASNPLADTIVGVACAGCAPFQSRRGFTSVGGWSTPPPSPGGGATHSFLLAPGVHAVAVIRGATDLRIFTSRDRSRTWTDAGRLPFLELRGLPIIVGPHSNPSILWGYKKPPAPGLGDRTGLARIDNVLLGRATWVSVDGGSGAPDSIARYCMGAGSFGCPTVYAGNPRNLAHMMAVNAANGEVHVTRDGRTWTVDDRLNAALRSFGASAGALQRSGSWPALQPNVIAFHPRNAEIFVGTESQGVFYSGDDGVTWRHVNDSRQIPAITSFAFGFDGDRDREVVYVSSYGRGLWKLRRVPEPRYGSGSGGMTVRGLPFYLDQFDPWVNYTVVDPATGGPLLIPIGPEDCPRCLLALVDANGKTLAFDMYGKQMEVAVEPPYKACESCDKLTTGGAKLGGAVLDDGKLLAVLALFPDTQPPIPPPQYEPVAPNPPGGPYVVLAGSVPGSLPTTTPGAPVTAFGSGFCTKPECGTITIRAGEEVLAENVKVDGNGAFQASFTLRQRPASASLFGPISVTFTQKGEGQTTFSDSSVLLFNRSEGEGQE